MIKKFLAFGVAALVMASLSVSAFAIPIYNTDQRTENGYTGKIYSESNSKYYKSFYASTSKGSRAPYIYADVLLENALNNAEIGSDYADGHNLTSVDAYYSAQYGTVQQVRVIGTHKGGNSQTELKAEFSLRQLYGM